ncbi:MAG: hypothetical protein IIW52_05160 [Alistipes sp.]|nr:hypothetical protein [Alistipes sp.]
MITNATLEHIAFILAESFEELGRSSTIEVPIDDTFLTITATLDGVICESGDGVTSEPISWVECASVTIEETEWYDSRGNQLTLSQDYINQIEIKTAKRLS